MDNKCDKYKDCETIDCTPTWEQWVLTALFSIANVKDTQEQIITLKDDFVNMARLADFQNEHIRNEK